jgi:hypothetical protein
MGRIMQNPVQEKPKDDFVSSISLWAFALAFGTIAMVVVGTLPHAPW